MKILVIAQLIWEQGGFHTQVRHVHHRGTTNVPATMRAWLAQLHIPVRMLSPTV